MSGCAVSSRRSTASIPPTSTGAPGGQEEPGRDERTPLKLGNGVDLQPIPSDKTLNKMLVDGELDAVFSAREISSFVNGAPNVGLMFPNYREAEMEYYKRSGMFPIMHLIGIRKTLVEKYPWLPGTVYKAFCPGQEDRHQRNEGNVGDQDHVALARGVRAGRRAS